MIDYSLITLIPAVESHREFSYQLKKTTMSDYVDQVWDWDDNIGRELHAQDWVSKRPDIILYDDEPIGTIYVGEYQDYIEIEQFYILPEYQNNGIGSNILKGILDEADHSGRMIKLMYLHINPVATLYCRMGFKVVGNNDPFVLVERKPGR